MTTRDLTAYVLLALFTLPSPTEFCAGGGMSGAIA